MLKKSIDAELKKHGFIPELLKTEKDNDLFYKDFYVAKHKDIEISYFVKLCEEDKLVKLTKNVKNIKDVKSIYKDLTLYKDNHNQVDVVKIKYLPYFEEKTKLKNINTTNMNYLDIDCYQIRTTNSYTKAVSSTLESIDSMIEKYNNFSKRVNLDVSAKTYLIQMNWDKFEWVEALPQSLSTSYYYHIMSLFHNRDVTKEQASKEISIRILNGEYPNA